MKVVGQYSPFYTPLKEEDGILVISNFLGRGTTMSNTMKSNAKKSEFHSSVVDRQRFDADKDPTFSVETLK
jgi:hypothetical protein